MIWATWRMHRSIFLASIAVAVALRDLARHHRSLIEAHAWTIFTSHHCSLNYPGSSAVCMSSHSGRGNFSTVNVGALRCAPGAPRAGAWECRSWLGRSSSGRTASRGPSRSRGRAGSS